jgi:hypothetical protein
MAHTQRRRRHLIVTARGVRAAFDELYRRTAVVAAAVLAASTVAGKPLATAEVVVRGAVGFGGLVGLGAVVLGTGRAWLAPVCWTALVLLGGWSGGEWYGKLLTWMTQSAGTAPATLTAVALAAAGPIAYALHGPADMRVSRRRIPARRSSRA